MVTVPTILSLKKRFAALEVTLVCSPTNHQLAKYLGIFDRIICYPKTGSWCKKLLFYGSFLGSKYDYVFAFDGKDRSLLCTSLTRCPHKTAIKASQKPDFFHRIFRVRYVDNDFHDSVSYQQMFEHMLALSGLNIKNTDFHYLKNSGTTGGPELMRGSGYVYVHLDEKWFVSLEKKQVLFDTQLTYDNFHRFIAKLTQKRPLLIATGAVDIPLINQLKERLFSTKLSANLFSSDSFDHAAHLVSGTSFTDCVDLLRNASIVITCHGGIVHLASACGVPIIDVVDKEYRHNKQKWVDHMSDQPMLTRTSFDDLAQSLLTELEAM